MYFRLARTCEACGRFVGDVEPDAEPE
jgi:hypothetical protein